MEFKKIYVDMDGVLTDFEKAVDEILGREAWETSKWEQMRKFPHFYRDLKPIDGSIMLLSELIYHYGDAVEILTGIPKEEAGIKYAAQDKRDWVKEWIPNVIKIHTVHRSQKAEFCKGSDYLLIDDLEQNISEWKEKDGSGLLFTTSEDTYEKLKELDPGIWSGPRMSEFVVVNKVKEILNTAMKERKMTCKELSEKSNVRLAIIRQLVAGEYSPSLDELEAVLDVFKIAVKDLDLGF